jgi:hypothetical protein
MQNRAASPARESYESTTQAIELIGAQWAFKPLGGAAVSLFIIRCEPKPENSEAACDNEGGPTH